MRKLLIILVFITLTGQTMALDFTIRDNCQDDENALFSISNTTNGHAANPSFYQGYTDSYNRNGKQVCASSDINNVEIREDCRDYISNPVFSFYDPASGTSHLSTDEQQYDHTLCSSNLATSVRRSCPDNTEPIISIYGPEEAHIAEPGHYRWQICGALFENASLAYEFTMEGNTEFVTNGQFGVYNTTDTATSGPGYGIAQNDSLMSGIVGNDLLPQIVGTQKTGTRYRVNLTEPVDGRTQWFLPYTTGDTVDVENRFDLIMSNSFMTQFNPNFAFTIVEDILITVTLTLGEADLIDSIQLGPGLYELIITNEGDNNQDQPQVGINATIS